MILPLFRLFAFLRIAREERDRYRDMLRGGALGDSDMPCPPANEALPGPPDVEAHERGADLPPRPPLRSRR